LENEKHFTELVNGNPTKITAKSQNCFHDYEYIRLIFGEENCLLIPTLIDWSCFIFNCFQIWGCLPTWNRSHLLSMWKYFFLRKNIINRRRNSFCVEFRSSICIFLWHFTDFFYQIHNRRFETITNSHDDLIDAFVFDKSRNWRSFLSGIILYTISSLDFIWKWI